jgi:uncharacterized membrane protein YedE/YeeE
MNAPGLLAKMSVLAAGALLLASLFMPAPSQTRLHPWISALPLALAALGYALLQLQVRPPRAVLMKRMLLAAAFLLWAIDQIMPAGRVAVFIGDAVIAAYVVDLFWMLRDQEQERAAGSGDGS